MNKEQEKGEDGKEEIIQEIVKRLSLDFEEDLGSYGEGASKSVQLLFDGKVISEATIR